MDKGVEETFPASDPVSVETHNVNVIAAAARQPASGFGLLGSDRRATKLYATDPPPPAG